MDGIFSRGTVCIGEDVAARLFTAALTSGIIITGATAEGSCHVSIFLSFTSCFQFLGQPSEIVILSLMIHEVQRPRYSSRLREFE